MSTFRALRHAVLAVLAVAAMVLVRSVVLERWITVVACAGLFLGAFATMRARTWGPLALLAVGSSFSAAAALDMGPAWFAIVTAVASVPALLTSPHMLRFDRMAALAALSLAVAWGTASAAALRWIGDHRDVLASMF